MAACEQLEAAGIQQYEISNFARKGFESRHNLKYWTRQPYLGFGVDAHSMLPSSTKNLDAVRFSTADALDQYVADASPSKTNISMESALEEFFFLGLRLTQGIDLSELAEEFGDEVLAQHTAAIRECVQDGLLERTGDRIRLTPGGRLLSNEVFARFVAEPRVAAADGHKSA